MRCRAYATAASTLAAIAAMTISAANASEMVFPGSDWEQATPESEGVDSSRLTDAVEYFKAHSGRDGVRELVIVRNGRVIWQGDNIDKVHGVWSCTKSFTSTVLGLLIEDGKCTLDTPAAEFAPELAEHYPDVTLRHFTTMTSGYRAIGDEPRGTYLHGPSRTPFDPSPEPLFTPPGSKYAYWDSAMNMFALVLTRIAGEPLEDLFRRRIADPIQMDSSKWDWGDLATIDGMVVNGGSGNSQKHIFISAREMARFGHLFLNDGRWNDRQLISRDWVRAATSAQVPASLPWGHPERRDGPGCYGFNWWTNGQKPEGHLKWPKAPRGMFAASGHNNNRCFVVPEWNMVVVRLGLDERTDGRIANETWGEFLGLIGQSLTDERASAETPRRQTEVSIRGEQFFINGRPTYDGRTWRGHKIEGLLLNSRMVQGIFDDLNPETVGRWAYPDTGRWDAERNTREFVAAMPEWRRHGLLGFTINLQGGSPQGYSREQPWHNSAFTADGSLRTDYMQRLERIIDRADELGMVVILGLFYFGQDERLADEQAIVRGVDNAVDWLFDRGYRNVLIEINNECNVARYDHEILKPARVHELIERAQHRTRDGRRFLVSTSYGGGKVPEENVARTADFLLLHGNGVDSPERIAEMVRDTRKVPGYRPMPILFNEDDHYDFDQPENNFAAALREYAAWGYFDYRQSGEPFAAGYQSVPADWGINHPRKQGFFNMVREVTGN